MNVKILKVCLILLGILAISGCTTKVEYVDRVQKVSVIEKCKVEKAYLCSAGKATYTEEIHQMLLCIKQLKGQVQVCTGGK